MNQKRATNWNTMKKSGNTICSTNGSTCQRSCGPRSSARIGEVWMILPVTTAMIAIQRIQVRIRQMRNLVQSEIRRWVIRSKPPKTVSVQNL